MSHKTEREAGQQPRAQKSKRGKRQLPPDPEQENDRRAANAKVAIDAFRSACFVEFEDALGDLLTNLMHLCDRDPRLGAFDAAHARALTSYEEETATDTEYARM